MKALSLPVLMCGGLMGGMLLTSCAHAQSADKPDGPNAAFWKELPKGPQVVAYYEGRSPCQEIAKMLKVAGKDECIKIKWQLVLFQDPVTKEPTTYAIGGFGWRNPPKTGKWAIAKGSKEDAGAVVYVLDPDEPEGFLSFLKADDNILYFLDNDRELLVGNEKFSYTLNRVPQ